MESINIANLTDVELSDKLYIQKLESMANAVKMKYGDSNYKIRFLQKLIKKEEHHHINQWGEMYNDGIDVKKYIYKYMKDSNVTFSKHMNSKILNIKSNIKEYTNKSGKNHMAHFTIHDKYLGSVSKLGNELIFYDGYFFIGYDDLDKFELDFKYIISDTDDKTFGNMFKIKLTKLVIKNSNQLNT